MAKEFTAAGFFIRWAFALLLVLGTYNPTDWSYISWVLDGDSAFGPPMALAGVALLICWIIFLRATLMSIGWLGIALSTALFGCVIWLLIDLEVLSLNATGALTWISLVVLSFILATGMSWSHIRRRMSGQFDVDDMDD